MMSSFGGISRFLDVPDSKKLQGKRDFKQWKRKTQNDFQAVNLWRFLTGEERLLPFPDPDAYQLDRKNADPPSQDPAVEFQIFVEEDATDVDEEEDPLALPPSTVGRRKKKTKKTIKKKKSELTPEELEAYEESLRRESRRGSRATLGPEQIGRLRTEGVQLEEDLQGLSFSNRLSVFRFEWDQASKSADREQTAMAGLVARVNNTLIRRIQAFDDPYSAMKWLESQYSQTQVRETEKAFDHFEKIHYRKFNSIQEYLNELESARQDIDDVGGKMTDGIMLSKVIRGLLGVPAFKGFIEHYHSFRDLDPSLDNYDILTARLLTWEDDQRTAREYERDTREKDTRRVKPERRDINTKKADKKPNVTCHECGKVGHYARDCRSTNKESVAKTTSKFVQTKKTTRKFPPKKFSAMTTVDIEPELDIRTKRVIQGLGMPGPTKAKEEGDIPKSLDRNTWIVDIGANMHFVNDKKWFADFSDFTEEAGTANGTGNMKIQGGGSVKLPFLTSDGFFELNLSSVAYVPTLRCNILSTSLLLCMNEEIVGQWDKDSIRICTSDGLEVARARQTNGLYELALHPQVSLYKPTGQVDDSKAAPLESMPPGVRPPYVAATIDFSDPVWKWHRRMGHLGLDNMRRLLKVSNGISITDKQLKAKLGAICPVCATTRAIVKVPREPATRRFKKPGELLHIDTWGLYPIAGYNGTKYLLLITDDSTRFTWSTRLGNKAEIPQKVRKLLKRIEKSLRIKVRRVRFDNKFSRNGLIDAWMSKHSITIEPTVAYAHFQNGVAERGHRTERDRAAAMLQEPTLPDRLRSIISERGEEILRNTEVSESLWPLAFEHAIWLKNRSPTRALKTKETPWQALYSEKPNLHREHVWFSRLYITVPHEQRIRANHTKLGSSRASLGYFVGNESESVYLYWDPNSKKVRRTASANVDDDNGPNDLHEGDGINARQERPQRENEADSESEGSDSTDSDSNPDEDDNAALYGDGSEGEPEERESDSESSDLSEEEEPEANDVPTETQNRQEVNEQGRQEEDTQGNQTVRNRPGSSSPLFVLDDDDDDYEFNQNYQRDDYDENGVPRHRPEGALYEADNFLDDIQQAADAVFEGINESQTTGDNPPVRSRFFANIVKRKKGSKTVDDSESNAHLTNEDSTGNTDHPGFDQVNLSEKGRTRRVKCRSCGIETSHGNRLNHVKTCLKPKKRRKEGKPGLKADPDNYKSGENLIRKYRLQAAPEAFELKESKDVSRIPRADRNIYSEESRQETREKLMNLNFPDSDYGAKSNSRQQGKRGSGVHTSNTLMVTDNAPSPPPTDKELDNRKTGELRRVDCLLCTAETELEPEPRTVRAALRSPEAEQWEHAIQEEYNSLIENETWKIKSTKQDLNARFDVSDLGECAYYLGMHVTRDNLGGIGLHQKAFVQKLLAQFGLEDLRPVLTPMDVARKLTVNEGQQADLAFTRRYQSMVGSLNYLITVARLDITYAVGVVSRYASNPNESHKVAVYRIYAYLKKYPKLGPEYSDEPTDDCTLGAEDTVDPDTEHNPDSTEGTSTPTDHLDEIVGYVDSDWAGCHDTRRSTTGFVFIIAGSPIA
ncbi:Retrovirus-related Pol polyprotein from transposon TNT 1-94 [Cercospora beticola]|uniref:Retrovirus-related Pol polyprotein from transposon TNT 1-94 n=1 Tax=Cercospora beticola TaxID=122368 RepID=A0A2G5HAM9_CERBT|nr:Retrovirus-related Pol polyprotein from transposon TNT 1-94 [Cercospora beticola]PIA89589.1 Retrovirus-related Pol polyprotein from transposon TNT 1-94 [Cercospora beticola]